MKRNTLLATAIAAALAAPLAAHADTSNVTVYGKFDVSYDFVNTGASAAGTPGTTSARVSSNTSRFGLKGSEDLGDGLSAIWQVESTVYVGNTANNTAGFGDRNTFGGLKSDSTGTVLLGRYDTPYRISTRRLDVFTDGVADNRSLFGGTTGVSAVKSFDGRQDQVVAYITPNLGGFNAAAAYVNLNPTLSTGTLGANANTTAQHAASLAGWYDANGIYVALAHEIHNLAVTAGTAGTAAAASATAVNVTEKATRAGIGYSQESFSLGLAYEKTSDNYGAANADKFGHNAIYASGKLNLPGNNALKAAYTKLGNIGNVANTGASQYSVGLDHSFSKRTTVYALYSKLNNNTLANYSLSSNGTAGASSSVGAGSSPSVVALGIAHSF